MTRYGFVPAQPDYPAASGAHLRTAELKRLFHNGAGKEARLCFMGHALRENRHRLIVDAVTRHSSGRAARRASQPDHAGRRQGL